MSNIPQVDRSKTFAIGAGVGSYDGCQALAIGAKRRIMGDFIMKAFRDLSESGYASFGCGESCFG